MTVRNSWDRRQSLYLVPRGTSSRKEQLRSELSRDRVLNALGRLVAKSLVVADHDQMGVRYRLLETVRAHAASQLSAAGETYAMQMQHAKFVLQFAERTPTESIDAAQAARLAPEEDNIRTALDWAVQQNQADVGMRLALAA
jgi:predicted ATPase